MRHPARLFNKLPKRWRYFSDGYFFYVDGSGRLSAVNNTRQELWFYATWDEYFKRAGRRVLAYSKEVLSKLKKGASR